MFGKRKGKNKQQASAPLILTYSRFLPDVKNILKRKRYILERSDRLRKIFPKNPMTAYKRGRNLKDILVHQKTARAVGARHGREDCGKDCVICKRWYTGGSLQGTKGQIW